MRWGVLIGIVLLAAWAGAVEWGMTLSTAAAMGQARAEGVRRVRLRAEWPRVQPAANRFDFAVLDAQVAAVIQAGLEPVLVFGPSPVWAITDIAQPTAEEAQRARPNLQAYARYVRAVADRYQTRVTYYQLWERPAPFTLLAMPADIYGLFRVGARTVHQVNPRLRAVAPEPGDVDISWLFGYLSTTQGADVPDVLLLAPARATYVPLAFQQRVSALRGLPAARAVEIWTDIPADPAQPAAVTALSAAALTIRASVLWFVPTVDATLPWTDDRLRPGFRWLAPLQGATYAGWGSIGGVPAGVYDTAASRRAVLVAGTPLSLCTAPLAQAATGCLPVTGNAVELLPADGDARAVAVPAVTPLALPAGPWQIGGIAPTLLAGTPEVRPVPVNAAFVTLDPTGANPAVIRPLCDTDGGQFRLLMVGGATVLSTVKETAPWINLDIPDGYLFFNTARRPVEVTVSVYGAQHAQKTGFNLYYDGLRGMTYTPWRWIDVGPTRVFTYTLRLTDALFANRDGYDIRVNMGGSEEELRITGVTVRVL